MVKTGDRYVTAEVSKINAFFKGAIFTDTTSKLVGKI